MKKLLVTLHKKSNQMILNDVGIEILKYELKRMSSKDYIYVNKNYKKMLTDKNRGRVSHVKNNTIFLYIGKKLSQNAKEYNEYNLYVGDDKKIYGE